MITEVAVATPRSSTFRCEAVRPGLLNENGGYHPGWGSVSQEFARAYTRTRHASADVPSLRPDEVRLLQDATHQLSVSLTFLEFDALRAAQARTP